ncbi:MAG: FmdB family zinc ribbon protein [Acidimicrobiia bacterium]
MPTYVYECAKCGDEFEVWQSFTDETLKKHPECGGKVAKVIQPAGIVLKGSGFYKNDSRNGAKRSTVPASGGDDTKSSSDSSSSSESSSSSSSDSSAKSNGAQSNGSKSDTAKDGGSSKPKATKASTTS